VEAPISDSSASNSSWRSVLRGIAVIAAVTALLPSGLYQNGAVRNEAEREFLVRNPDALPFRSDYSFGIRSSPLVHRYSEATLGLDDRGKVIAQQSSAFEVNVLSWSMASLLGGILLFWLTKSREKT
jgi:hypothetical protein